MSNGRAAFLLRRLSSGENKIKNVNLNSSCIDHTILIPVCGHRDFDQRKRLSSFSASPTCVKTHPKLTRSLSDNIIKMSSNIEANIKIAPKHTNRLSNEKSPYLLQHAHNPVDWYPWCTEAINRARAEKKLIFLSIGYSTCHWCHVMEKESFESEEVAKIMNENYINIKVDREERPDIDHIYMLFVMATTGAGGWPMSVFLTPDLQPVAGGTYFPPAAHYGKPGFSSILLSLALNWKKNHAEFVQTASNVMQALHLIAKVNDDSTPIPGERAWTKCINSYKQTYDPVFGGFGNAPKFPQASIFNFLFHFYARDKTNSEAALCLEMCLHTLKKIANGGIHDHISSGFSRYSVDGEWHVPHFEKMLYDQAQLTSVYTDAYLASKDEFFANVVRDIIKYVNRDLRHECGGYYSAEDADSYPTFNSTEKKEGAFYVWPYSEIKSLLEDKQYKSVKHLDLFCYHFNIESLGNIAPESDPHNELKFQNVLIVYGSNEDTMRKFDLNKEEFDNVMKECIDTLFVAQQKRPRPHLDTKMLCSWNGLMIAGLAHAGQGLGDYSYVEDAIKAAKFVKEHLFDDCTKSLFHSCYRAEDGTIAQTLNPIQGFLDDYAFLIKGLLNLYEASLDLQWLSWAQHLQKMQDALFWDKENGGYFLSSDDDDTVVMRLKEDSDGAEPSGNSVSCQNLLRLAAYGDKSVCPEGGEYEREMAKKILTVFAKKLTEHGLALPEMMSALMFYTDSPTQVLISGKFSDPRTLELVRVVRSRLLPGRVLAVADPADTASAGTSDILLSRIRPCGDTPAAYVCRRYACSLPVTDVKQLETLLDEPALPVSNK